MRILYITTIGATMGFFKNLIRELIKEGHTVDIATNDSETPVPQIYNELGCKIYHISTSRSPFSMGNIKAVKEIKEIARDYDIVHCHTPLAAAATRVACKGLRKKALKVIYTAHGFHFYKGAPLKNWLIYYPIEKICSHWTDVLITINKEDYALAQKKMKAKQIEYVPGVGIDVAKFANTTVDRAVKRKELGFPEDALLLLSVGELNENKNHQVVLKALAEVEDKNIHYAIAGTGGLHDYLLEFAEQLGLKDRFHLLGFCNNVNELYKVADAFVLPSIREGLNVSTMEAMASGLSCIVSKIRGNVDMVDENGGYLCVPTEVDDFKKAIESVENNSDKMSEYNKSKASIFSESSINKKIKDIYRV